MTTLTSHRITIWHEDEIPMMLSAPRPGAGSHARDFHDPVTGRSFRISSGTKSAASRRENPLLSPRHRHTFDQVRFYISGDTQYGSREVYGAGDFLYIPAGTYYGPMRPPPDSPNDDEYRLFYMQFQGRSGFPYYNSEEFLEVRAQLESKGHFENGIFVWNDGHKQDGWEALLQEKIGEPVVYSSPALTNYVVVRSKNLSWQAMPENDGIEMKFLGHFTEVGPNAILIRMTAGTTVPGGQSPVQQARCLIEGSVRFSDAPDRIYSKTTNQYIPAATPYGPTECIEDATMLIVKWADDDLFLPDATV
jgi:hypothetical protein